MVNLPKAALALVTLPCLIQASHLWGQTAAGASGSYASLPGKFSDVTSALGVHFEYRASHTEKKYLLETMGPGVALFDYDNDGRLDIFLVNGAPLNESMAKDSIPQKTGPEYWNRLYH